jgi:serine/threonine-protein kinase
MTQTSAVIGTAQYLSPEQARGEAVDARSDVYAAGCVLFELLVGHPPFVGDSPVSVAYQHVREDPRPPSELNPDVPPDVDAIVLKALAKNPLNRYQSAQEMRADALRAVAGRPVLATPVMSQAETMALGGPMRAPGAATGMTRQVTSVPPPRPPERKTSSWVMAVLAALGVLAVVALGIGLALARDNNKGQTPATVAMPDLLGKSEAQAVAALQQQKFTAFSKGSSVEQDNCDTPVVAKQSPDPNTNVQVDQPVTYQLCKGPDKVTVPTDLVGKSQDDATAQLQDLGLKVDVDNVNSDAEKGTVTAVEKAGQQVDKDSTITISVSKGNLVPVPYVVGLPVDAAKTRLEGLGFNVSVKEGDPGPTPGIVTDQDPQQNTKLAKGKTVTITVTPDQPNPGDTGTPTPTPSGGNGGGNGGPVTGGLLR